MPLETTLTFLMMAGVVVAFLVLHTAFRRLPYTQAVPRERFVWPVWNWYALVVAFGLLTGLSANLYWNARIPRDVHANDMTRAYPRDAGAFAAEPDPSEIRRVSGTERTETPVWASPGSGAAPAVTPATGAGPAWATTPGNWRCMPLP